MVTRSLRGLGAGALSIVLALDLQAAHYAPLLVGLALGLALGFGSAWSLVAPRLERRWGRRRTLLVGAVSLAAGGLLLWFDLANPAVLLAALALGGIVAGLSDVSPLGALEQAALADVTDTGTRTRDFALYNLLGYLGGAFGALVAGPLYAASAGAGSTTPHDLTMLLYMFVGLAVVPAYLGLSREAARLAEPGPAPGLSRESRSRVLGLAGLFSVDAFGGGLIVNSLVVYYLVTRFSPPVDLVGLLFFASNLAAALSLVLAVPIARRIGLVRTMVFTHLPSSVLLIAFAVAPVFWAATLLWVLRATLSQMDVPTRQAFTQVIVPARERASAAGLTTASRSASALGGPVTGAFLGAGGPWLAGPFVLAGSIKIAYDLALYAGFRNVGPVEAPPPGARGGAGTGPGPR